MLKFFKLGKSERIIIWNIKDILIVICSFLFINIVFYLSIVKLFGNNEATSIIVKYISLISLIAITIFWIKKKYGLNKEALGLRKGKLSTFKSFVIGTLTALNFHLLTWPVFFSYLSKPSRAHISFLPLLMPLSLGGFATIILTPVGEEIFDRGFIYGYLRNKIGIFFGLIVQAVFFSISHLDTYTYGREHITAIILYHFLMGLILGILYEKTKSLYPSMAFHGFVNYLVTIRYYL